MSYRPKPYHGRVLLFRRGFRAVSRHLDAKLGWSSVISGEFNVVEIQGGHGDMLCEPGVQHTAAELAACLQDLCKNKQVRTIVDNYFIGQPDPVSYSPL
jgi:thioesterase domain-containing protein